MWNRLLLICLTFLAAVSCGEEAPDDFRNTLPEGYIPYMTPDEEGDVIPDFSRVGYRFGDEEIPDYPVAVTLTPPSDGSDATVMIQEALDEAAGSCSAVLLKKGVYNISDTLRIDMDGVVLRGEGQETVLRATGVSQRSLITLGRRTSRRTGASSAIVDDYTPVGQMWVRVEDPSLFAVGDRVAIYRRPNAKWVADLHMDRIPQNSSGSVSQWNYRAYYIWWERFVTAVEGDVVRLDNPVVMALESEYLGENLLCHVSWDRTVESGVENLRMESGYDPSVLDSQGRETDEAHAWTAVTVASAEHCWVRDVTCAHFGYALADILSGAKNITVKDCVSTAPVSKVTGSRRYAFHLNGGEQCLIENCVAEDDRHGFITASKVPGPNVFLECRMVRALSDMGPHQRWATGVLYDCCSTDGLLAVQDRDNWGTGQGWAGVNFVLWNCSAATLTCQSPWVSGQNWCIGCTGSRSDGREYADGLARPSAVWKSHGVPTQPASLYRRQLANRQLANRR